MIAGIVLAAGLSSRLGRPKQLLPIHGEPLIRHTLRRILASSLEQVFVVVGHDADAISEALNGLPVKLVVNPDAAHGQSTSVIAGLDAIALDTEAALFLLGDQPGVDPALIDALIQTWRETRAPIVAPVYIDGLGNPVLFDRSVFPELTSLEGDVGARPIVREHERAGRLHLVPVASRMPPDIDTESDYAAFISSLPRSERGCSRSNGQTH